MHKTVVTRDKGANKAKKTTVPPRKLSTETESNTIKCNNALNKIDGNNTTQRVVKRIALMRTVGFIHFSGDFLIDSKVFAPCPIFY